MRALVALWIVSFCLPTSAQAQTNDKKHADEKWCAERLIEPIDAPIERRRYALTMSGGGFRAMLFHVGALQRLNDAGFLAEIGVVSSVSGGSITAGALAANWPRLTFDERATPGGRKIAVATNFNEVIRKPLSDLADKTIDFSAALAGLFPGGSSADRIANTYDDELFDGLLLDRIDKVTSSAAGVVRVPIPHFVFNATSLQTGELWQFRPRVMGGPVLGWTDTSGIRLAQAVAASSAFPPFLSPLYLRPASVDDKDWHTCELETHVHGTDPNLHTGRSIDPDAPEDVVRRFREEVYLTDGGVRDNLGLVAISHINERRTQSSRQEFDILASDAGRSFGPEERPYTNWLIQGYRVLNIATNEPDILRIDSLISRAVRQADVPEITRLCRQEPGKDAGKMSRWRRDLCFRGDAAYWSSERMLPHHGPPEHGAPAAYLTRPEIRAIGRIATRLKSFDPEQKERIVNWGYVSAHYGLPFIGRLWSNAEIERLKICDMPYPNTPLTGDSERWGKLCQFRGQPDSDTER